MTSSRYYAQPTTLAFATFTIALIVLLASTRVAVEVGWRKEGSIISHGEHLPLTGPFKDALPLSAQSLVEQLSSPADSYLSVDHHFSHDAASQSERERSSFRSTTASALESLFSISSYLNPITSHIRIPNVIQNVSLTPANTAAESRRTFNPTIMALPYWSPNQYLIVTRVVTEGLHQESIMCEANACCAGGTGGNRAAEGTDCNDDDVSVLGAAGGLRCAHDPVLLDIPSTPSEECTGDWAAFPDIPGFHDPRIFWSGKGEPLIIVNSHSRYACFGLWITDLRNLYGPLKSLLSTVPDEPTAKAPLTSYPFLTELTRNPRSSRRSVEKNWLLFFPSPSTSYVHYDLSFPSERLTTSANGTTVRTSLSGRSFAKLIGNGFTTPNLTSPLESLCLPPAVDPLNQTGHWHQASNSLKLVLCRRREAELERCDEDKTVHFAVIHRKFSNAWDLPLRYERFFVVWDTKPPFRMLAMSQYPIQFWNETASGWTVEENWKGTHPKEDREGMGTDMGGERKGEERERGRNITFNIPWQQQHHQKPFTYTNSSSPPTDASTHPDNLFLYGKNSSGVLLNININDTNTDTNNEDVENRTNYPPPPPPPPPLWSATFTYTPSIAWAWRPKHSASSSSASSSSSVFEDLQTGYLDDDLILGIGVDDTQMVFGRASAERLLQGLRGCPGILYEDGEGEDGGSGRRGGEGEGEEGKKGKLEELEEEDGDGF